MSSVLRLMTSMPERRPRTKSTLATLLALTPALGALPLLAGCGRGAVRAPLPVGLPETAPTATRCERVHPGVGAARLSPLRASSAVALARVRDDTIAYVADADEPVLHTVDVAAGRELATTTLHGNPEQVLVLGDGRVAVTLRRANALEVLEPEAEAGAPLESRCVVDVPTEPIALALTPDDGALLVTSAWAHTLSAFDAASLAPKFAVDLPREPRAVIVSDDGARAFVAHVVGAKMSVVDLGEQASRPREVDLRARLVDANRPRLSKRANAADGADLRAGCQGFALAKSEGGRVFAPMVSVDPGDPRSTPSGYGSPDVALGTETGEVAGRRRGGRAGAHARDLRGARSGQTAIRRNACSRAPRPTTTARST